MVSLSKGFGSLGGANFAREWFSTSSESGGGGEGGDFGILPPQLLEEESGSGAGGRGAASGSSGKSFFDLTAKVEPPSDLPAGRISACVCMAGIAPTPMPQPLSERTAGSPSFPVWASASASTQSMTEATPDADVGAGVSTSTSTFLSLRGAEVESPLSLPPNCCGIAEDAAMAGIVIGGLSKNEATPACEGDDGTGTSDQQNRTSRKNFIRNLCRELTEQPDFKVGADNVGYSRVVHGGEVVAAREGVREKAPLLTSSFACPLTGEVFESGSIRKGMEGGLRIEDCVAATKVGREEPYFGSPEHEPVIAIPTEARAPSFMSSRSVPYKTPVEFLINNYSKKFRIPVVESDIDFLTESLSSRAWDPADKNWWTSTFTCPVTGEVFEAGTLSDNANLDCKVRIADGRTYYNKQNFAKHAAAARAIDCLSFRQTLEEKGEGRNDIMRLCSEQPYRSPEREVLMDMATNGEMIVLPKLTLTNQYWRNEGVKPNTFILESIAVKGSDAEDGKGEADVKTWWTGSFTCPLTCETFSAGTLLQWPCGGLNHRRIIGNSVYYESKRAAQEAAAAKAIDCLSSRGQNPFSQERVGRVKLCAEKPYNAGVTRSLSKNEQCRKKGIYFMSPKGVDMQKPVHFLQYQFRRFFPGHPASSFEVSHIDHAEEGKVWTATFTCPLSSERFEAGEFRKGCRKLLRDPSGKVFYRSAEDAEHAAAARAIDCFSLREYAKHNENRDILAQEEGVIRLCEEAPYLNGTDTVPKEHAPSPSQSWDAVDHNLTSRFDVKQSSAGIAIREDGDEHDDDFVVQQVSAGSDIISRDPVARSTMERIIEAWVDAPSVATSFTTTSSSLGGKDPLAIANVDVAMPGVALQRAEALSSALEWYQHLGGANLTSPDRQAGLKERAEVMCKTPRPVTVAATNAVLEALGKANSFVSKGGKLGWLLLRTMNEEDSKIANSREGVGDVELAAERILHTLLTECEESVKRSTECFADPLLVPNTATFNAYIRCLSRPTLLESAEVAESLLNDMSDKKSTFLGRNLVGGRGLPVPDVDTYNAVLESWAAVRGEPDLCRRKINDLFSMLEMQMLAGSPASLTSNKEFDLRALRPNRSSFLIALSSLASSYDSKDIGCQLTESEDMILTSFSADEALVLIDRMSKMADMFVDDTLRPDTEVYNAPLRRSGACHGIIERSVFPWDDYATIFKEGFRQTSLFGDTLADKLTTEAQRTERWLLDMEQASAEGGQSELAPNIETYEAVIQAWVRTGTLEGLLRAESWAMRALASAADTKDESLLRSGHCTPRLQTFHPIICAWINCWNERGPERVQEWIQRLHETSKDLREMRPDGRIRAAPILAWRKYQQALLNTHFREEIDRSDETFQVNRANASSLGHGAMDAGDHCFFDEDANAVSDSNDTRAREAETKANSSVLEEIMTAANNCMNCLECLCSEWRSQNISGTSKDFFLDGIIFAHAINAWGEAAAVCAACEGARETRNHSHNESSTDHAVNEMLRALNLFDEMLDACRLSFEQKNGLGSILSMEGKQQLRHFVHISHKLYCNAVSHILALDVSVKSGSVSKSRRESYFKKFFPDTEKMLRRSAELDVTAKLLNSAPRTETENDYITDQQARRINSSPDACKLEYADLFSYEGDREFAFPLLKSNCAHQVFGSSMDKLGRDVLYSKILEGCQSLSGLSDSGDAIRATMFIMNLFSPIGPGKLCHVRANGCDQDLTDLYVNIIQVVDSVVSNPYEKNSLLFSIYTNARDTPKGINTSASSVKVDMEAIVGALKMCDVEVVQWFSDDVRAKKSAVKRKRVIRRRHRSRSKG